MVVAALGTNCTLEMATTASPAPAPTALAAVAGAFRPPPRELLRRWQPQPLDFEGEADGGAKCEEARLTPEGVSVFSMATPAGGSSSGAQAFSLVTPLDTPESTRCGDSSCTPTALTVSAASRQRRGGASSGTSPSALADPEEAAHDEARLPWAPRDSRRHRDAMDSAALLLEAQFEASALCASEPFSEPRLSEICPAGPHHVTSPHALCDEGNDASDESERRSEPEAEDETQVALEECGAACRLDFDAADIEL
mmetsp:Transcript_118724/g.335842  ORF Transcript_118724/g.335842 Transcript_118724/m.335842 type:complete len:254 (+) Transcript_118724:113-874(+)|eukprot:CAMPEP_0117537042 /NCGR_PEP_ID=MMETSP0784-20121206/41763_1 /TAXON_ID=39447 /ORGANISM="" /LENGTH=253 /DNA_ID=CAMNT_0005333621 /DNA_START=51 /DNA_END=812 /DNA_ORIENTATION=+